MKLSNWIYKWDTWSAKELKNILWMFRKGRKKALLNEGFDIDDKDFHTSAEIEGANREHRETFN